MNKADRIYKLHNLLQSRRFVSRRELQHTLEVSRATLTRDIEFLRNRMNAPILFDPTLGGYRLEESDATRGTHELPGLWFNESEIGALLAIEKIIESIQPGILASHIAPLKRRMESLLGKSGSAPEEIRRRILLLPGARRIPVPGHFETCSQATIGRRRLRINHRYRQDGTSRFREVSPQRLVRYKDNWYLVAWCHLRDALRTFSVDAITEASLLSEDALDIPDDELDAVLSDGYGIYAGGDVEWAVIRFTPRQARWTSSETWHPMQRGRFDSDGSFILELPYSGYGEIVMNILAYGPDAVVESPPSLRELVASRIADAAMRYSKP